MRVNAVGLHGVAAAEHRSARHRGRRFARAWGTALRRVRGIRRWATPTLALAVLVGSVQVESADGQAVTTVLRPSAVYDGGDGPAMTGWVVVIEGNRIVAVGDPGELDGLRGADIIELPGLTLMPGLIEGHSHVLLYPYDQTPWTDQVLNESLGLRTARAVVHAEQTLRAGVTSTRDLGAEGAGYADVGIRDAIEQGVIPGPRMWVAGPAIVATGSYNPKGAPELDLPKGAEEADGVDDLIRVVRDQIGRGADWVKVYADYRWGPDGSAAPTFTQRELETIVEVSESSGRQVVAHASTAEGMRRATLAGVRTIEHGDAGTPEIFRLMAERGVAFCPTIAAGDAISQYGGWRKGVDPDPARITAKRESVRAAVEAGVAICFGGDVGVFPHGENVRELELMVEYGVPLMDALRAATSGNADIFGVGDRLGRVKAGYLADLIAVEGNPVENLSALTQVRFVMKDGRIVRYDEETP